MILGVDLGNWNIKTSEGNIFPARYTIAENILGSTGDVLEYEGIKYYLKDGKLENNYDKANKETNIILFLYALALQKDSYFKIVVGLPALTYKNNKDTFKDKLLNSKIHDIKINEQKKKLIIEDIIVFPEAAGAYFNIVGRDKNAIIIDIGGGTTNIVEFKNGKLVNCTTLGEGMIQIYTKARDYINSRYSLKIELEDMETYLREGLRVDGEDINWNFFSDIKFKYMYDLANEIRNFNWRTSQVYLTGGGSKLFKTMLMERIKGIKILEDYLFSNAKGFKRVGEAKWKE